MNYSVKTIRSFERQAKHLVKKYPSLKNELLELIDSLAKEPLQGEALGSHCYKIRLGIESKGKGKSGGGRIITCVQVLQRTVYLLSIFDKSERESISNKELKELLKFE